jgi:hypothetical protein
VQTLVVNTFIHLINVRNMEHIKIAKILFKPRRKPENTQSWILSLRSWYLTSSSRNSLSFKTPQFSLQFSQQFTTGTRSQPHEISSPQHVFLTDQLQYYIHIYSVLSQGGFPTEILCEFLTTLIRTAGPGLLVLNLLKPKTYLMYNQL